MTMFVVPRDRPHSRPEFRPHRREGGEQHVRESRSEPDSLGSVSLLVHGAAPELPTVRVRVSFFLMRIRVMVSVRIRYKCRRSDRL